MRIAGFFVRLRKPITMKLKLLSLIFLLISSVCLAQKTKLPKNLKQTIEYLNKDCSDSLRTIIIKTPDKELKKLIYPSEGYYKTIFYLTNGKNSYSQIARYLSNRGIDDNQDLVILITFKRFLEGKRYNGRQTLKHYKKLELKRNSEYELRYTIDSIQDIYIPKDLYDSFNQINIFWHDTTKVKVKEWSEKEFTGNTHDGFGRWMRNNWQLWRGSRLSKYFNDIGIVHPDDMSGIILTSYYRQINDKDIKLEEQIQYYKNYWEELKKQEDKVRDEELNKYKVGNVVLFEYRFGFRSKQQEDAYDNESCIAEGIVTGLDYKQHRIKVKLIKSCDKKGIISYNNNHDIILNKKTGEIENPKRKTKYLKQGKKAWFYYALWKIQE